MKWESLDEMGQEFVCRSNDVNGYVWRERYIDSVKWHWQVTRIGSNTKVTGHITAADAAFDQAEEAIAWLCGTIL